MREIIFDYDNAFPPEVLPAVRTLIDSLAWLLPDWCQRVRIFYMQSGDPDGKLASCQCNYEYRCIEIDWYPALLCEDGPHRSRAMIHELLHGSINVLYNFAFHEIGELVPESEAPKYRAALLRELNARNESVVQDLTASISRRLESLSEDQMPP